MTETGNVHRRGGKRHLQLPLLTVLVVGVVARAVLLPITRGQDFTVWDLATRATLHGVNIYAHHPAYLGGPFAYFPLFLYVELPLQWLALHTGISFTVLGKLPIVAADLVTALLIASETRRLVPGRRPQAIAAALFFLNPLVVYNGAFYGRFDSVCVALLLLALRGRGTGAMSWRHAVGYAAAVAVKTFPVFLLPWLLRRDRTTALRVTVACAALLLVVASPYLATTPVAFVRDLFYNAGKLPNGVSWQVVFARLPTIDQAYIGDVLLAAFLAVAIALAVVDDWILAAAVTLLLFLVFSKQVIEQYLIWPLPFVVLLAVARRSRAAWLLVALLTVTGALVNAYVHPFGQHPEAISVIFAVALLATTLRLLATDTQRRRAVGELPPVSLPG